MDKIKELEKAIIEHKHTVTIVRNSELKKAYNEKIIAMEKLLAIFKK